jgi:hypothetical protein
MKISSLIAIFLLATLALGACGDDSSGGSGTTKDALFQELCAAADECCKAAGKANSVASCVAFYTAFSADKTADPANVQTCIDKIKALRSTGAFCANDDAADAECDGIFSSGSAGGTKQPGEACESSGDCARPADATEANCVTTFTSGPEGSKEEQYCIATVTRKEGEACEDLAKGYEAECDKVAGAYCDFSTKKCKLPGTEGQPCSPGNSRTCKPELYCASDGGTATCAPKIAAGAACKPFSNGCADGTYCGPSETCEAQLPDGAPCQNSESCSSQSCLNGTCNKGSSGGATLCFN